MVIKIFVAMNMTEAHGLKYLSVVATLRPVILFRLTMGHPTSSIGIKTAIYSFWFKKMEFGNNDK